MAKYEDPKITVSLDDESKELLKRIADALERQNPMATDVSFGDQPGGSYPVKRLVERDDVVKKVEYGGRTYRLHMEGEGDYLLHDDNHEGEELE